MPDDHSEVEPHLPIPNRTVKRFSADDSEHSLVKVGHRQANLHHKGHPKRVAFWLSGRADPSGPWLVRPFARLYVLRVPRVGPTGWPQTPALGSSPVPCLPSTG